MNSQEELSRLKENETERGKETLKAITVLSYSSKEYYRTNYSGMGRGGSVTLLITKKESFDLETFNNIYSM